MSTKTEVSTSPKKGHFRNEDGSVKKKRIVGHSVSLVGLVATFVWDPFLGILTTVGGQAVAWYDEVITLFKRDPFKMAEIRKSLKGLGFSKDKVVYVDKTLSELFAEWDKHEKLVVANLKATGAYDTKPIDRESFNAASGKLLGTYEKEKVKQMLFVEQMLKDAAELKAAA